MRFIQLSWIQGSYKNLNGLSNSQTTYLLSAHNPILFTLFFIRKKKNARKRKIMRKEMKDIIEIIFLLLIFIWRINK